MLLRAQGFSETPPAHVLGLDPPPYILSWLISWNSLSFRLYLGSAANNPVSHGQPSWGLAPAGSTEGVGPMPQGSAPSTLLLQPSFLRRLEGLVKRECAPFPGSTICPQSFPGSGLQCQQFRVAWEKSLGHESQEAALVAEML